MSENTNIRALALKLLDRCEASGSYSNIVLDTEIKRQSLSGSDRALLTLLFYGVIEKKITLDHIIDSLSSISPSKIEKTTRNLLRLGLYQIIYTEKIPNHAAVNETVSLSNKRSRGFVNAILRSYLRSGDSIVFPLAETDGAKYLSVRYSVGEPLCKALLKAYPLSECEKMLEAFSCDTPITLCANTLKIGTDELFSSIAKKYPDARRGENAPRSIILPACPVGELEELKAGLCTVQDEASQICVCALDAQPDEYIADVCACPGSKSFGSAIAMGNTGKIIAFDIHKNKLSLIEGGAERLGISIIETKEADAREFIPEHECAFDRIICDVPCSGFGVISKKPELRYKDPEDSARLPEIQADILENVSKYLKNGGVLVYSTCTVLPNENQDTVNNFLKAHKDFSLVPFAVGNINSDGMITLLPHIHGTDGFFIAKLKKG